MLAGKERLIKRAVTHKLGRHDWKIEDIKGRGEFIITHEKSEVFVFDGEALIDFSPIEFDKEGSVIRCKQIYILLYT